MKQTISKCDKCKKQTDKLIDVSLVNPNKTTEEEENKDRNDIRIYMNFWGQSKHTYPAIKVELCEDCTQVLLHWLGHPENAFTRVNNG